MAQKVAVSYTDDIDGSKAAETVSFGLDGARYQIDLSTRNARALRKALAEFVAAGRQVRANGASAPRGAARPAGGRSGSRSAARTEASSATVRAWAAQNGITVSPAGASLIRSAGSTTSPGSNNPSADSRAGSRELAGAAYRFSGNAFRVDRASRR